MLRPTGEISTKSSGLICSAFRIISHNRKATKGQNRFTFHSVIAREQSDRGDLRFTFFYTTCDRMVT